MFGYSVFNLLHLQHMPLLWLPQLKGEGTGFGMEILGMLCVSWARWQRYPNHCDLDSLTFLSETVLKWGFYILCARVTRENSSVIHMLDTVYA